MIPIIGGSGFSPLNIPNCALWLEADIASVTLDGSNNVNEWRDKSGNGRHLSQSDAAKRPAYTTSAIGGLPGITFDGTSKALARALDNITRNQTAVSVISVYKHSATLSANQTFLWSFHTGTAVGRFTMSRDASTTWGRIGGRRLDGDSSQNADGAELFNTNANVMTAIGYWGDSAAYVWLNGTSKVSDTTWLTDGATSDTDSDYFVVGCANQAGGTSAINSIICMILAYQKNFSTAERQQLERWCGSRYGITVA